MRATMVLISIIGLLWQADLCYSISKDVDIYHSDRSEKWKKLDHYAEQIYQASVTGELKNIQQVVMEMENLFTETTFNPVTNVEGVRALRNEVVQVQRILSSISPQQEELLSATARLRLAMDAITHPKQAMWLQYEPILRDDIAHLLATDQREAWLPLAQCWLQHIDRILPAATIQRDDQTIERMESLRQLVTESISGQHTPKQVNAILNKYSEMVMIGLFGSSKANPTLATFSYHPMPLQWTLLLAFMVCILLAYVAYKKYQYEQYAIRPGRFPKIKK